MKPGMLVQHSYCMNTPWQYSIMLLQKDKQQYKTHQQLITNQQCYDHMQTICIWKFYIYSTKAVAPLWHNTREPGLVAAAPALIQDCRAPSPGT